MTPQIKALSNGQGLLVYRVAYSDSPVSISRAFTAIFLIGLGSVLGSVTARCTASGAMISRASSRTGPIPLPPAPSPTAQIG